MKIGNRCIAAILACVLLHAQLVLAAPDPEALLQSKSRLREGFASQVQETTRQIDSGQHQGKALARLLRERGVNQSHLLAYDKAIEDFSRAIDIDGFNTQYYQDRAVAYLRSRQFTKAEEDLGMLLGLDRGNFSGLREKGRTAFYRGNFLEAADYFLQAAQTPDREAKLYAMLWVSMAAQRAGRPSPISIEAPSDAARDQWPVPIAELFIGRITPEQVKERAEANNPRAHLMLQCEAQFYLGQHYLIKGEKELARASFMAAVDTGITDFMEYDWAVRELEMLSGK